MDEQEKRDMEKKKKQHIVDMIMATDWTPQEQADKILALFNIWHELTFPEQPKVQGKMTATEFYKSEHPTDHEIINSQHRDVSFFTFDSLAGFAQRYHEYAQQATPTVSDEEIEKHINWYLTKNGGPGRFASSLTIAKWMRDKLTNK